MIQQGFWVVGGKSTPTVYARERAILPCGCVCYVGIRADTREAATSAASCSPAHVPQMELFTEALQNSLENPTSRPLVEVADEFLTLAACDG